MLESTLNTVLIFLFTELLKISLNEVVCACGFADEAVKRYNEANKEWGFGQLIPLSTFYNPNVGYIVQDTCSFGAEIFIVKPAEQQEKVTFVSNPPDNVFTWRVRRFSSLEDKFYYSNEFLVGDRYWLVLYLITLT